MNIKAKIIYQSIVGISVIMLISGWSLGYSDDAQVVARASITIAKVEAGDFAIKVEGYGSLQSVNKRLLTATSNAMVDEIKLKAGAVVTADTVILVLKNPELTTQLRQALAELQNAKNNKRQINLQQQREMLNNESSLSELESESEIAMLQVEAERILAKNGIVSGIVAKKNELKAKQLQKRVVLEKSKIAKLIVMQEESLAIQDDLISQAQEEFDVTKQMVEQLSVKAGINGVIQRLSLNLGQSVSAGAELALIGSLSPLVAEIKVPQLQAYMVSAGMKAMINTINGSLAGHVVRVDPVVVDGAVQVDIELSESNDSVKPMQLVDATVFAQVQENVNYIKTPTGVNENTTVKLFKLSEDNRAMQVEVKFGKTSGQIIQVLSGLKAGDKVISSRLDLPKEVTQIKLSS
ncbi:MAG: HlyD family efflux transporter periplasmic adaptor subunit [Colwellia sp.]|nr:HlyD family efflux transporter periplasmic adaptor subunit [Colwellia sp.]